LQLRPGIGPIRLFGIRARLPEPTDDVYSNNFTVTIDISPTILSIRNGATTGINDGGRFTIGANGITLTADLIAKLSGANVNLLNITIGGGSIANIVGTITAGNATAGSGPDAAIFHTGAGTVNITGSVTGGTTVSSSIISAGVYNNTTGIINITGNVVAGSSGGTSNFGARNISTGTINIVGNVTATSAASGVSNSGTATITGTVTGGSGSGAGFTNTGTLTHIGPAFASATAPAIGPGSASQVTILTGPLVSTEGTGVLAAASGVNPCQALRWFPMDTALGTFTYIMRGRTASGDPSSRPERILALPEGFEAGYPDPSDVRLPVPYGPADLYTGTCAVPAPTSVLTGVPVDDTVGSFVASASDLWNAPIELVGSPGSIAERMKNTATVQSVGAQIEALGT
jgi:hypothetical protein